MRKTETMVRATAHTKNEVDRRADDNKLAGLPGRLRRRLCDGCGVEAVFLRGHARDLRGIQRVRPLERRFGNDLPVIFESICRSVSPVR